MINFGSVVAIVAMGFWKLAAVLLGLAGKTKAAAWCNLRVMYCSHRGEYWDKGGILWNWKRFRYLQDKYSSMFGIRNPNQMLSYFSYYSPTISPVILAERLNLGPDRLAVFMLVVQKDFILRPVQGHPEGHWSMA